VSSLRSCAANGRIGQTDGDSAEGAGIQLRVPLHDVERTLGGERVVVLVDTVDDFALFCLGVWGDGEAWACGGMIGFRSCCAGRRDSDGIGFRLGVGGIGRSGGWVHERDGGGTEFRLSGDDFDVAAEDGGVGGHVVVVWKCWWR
jgi:hypothetical protein